MGKQIAEKYNKDINELYEKLINENIIRASHEFCEGGFDYIKSNYQLIFTGVGSNKIRKATQKGSSASIRSKNYLKLKELWEQLNEKVILEYKLSEENFKSLFIEFLKEHYDGFSKDSLKERKQTIIIKENKQATSMYEKPSKYETHKISTMNYADFLKRSSSSLNININTLHQSFIALINKKNININEYLNFATITAMKQGFDKFLMSNAFDKFCIEYQRVSNVIHPTKFTDEKGNPKEEISASNVGVLCSNEMVDSKYLFKELFYDSELEKDNIKTSIKEVVVFTKIPKESIKIPVAGGRSYSPDFAYVLEFKSGEKKLYFIVETKGADEGNLRVEESQKIKHAEKFFANTKVKFKTQYSGKKIEQLIEEILY